MQKRTPSGLRDTGNASILEVTMWRKCKSHWTSTMLNVMYDVGMVRVCLTYGFIIVTIFLFCKVLEQYTRNR